MSDENLGAILDEGYRARAREVALKNLGKRTYLNLDQLAKLVAHETHGETVKDITLQELIDVALTRDEGDGQVEAPKAAKKKSAKKVAKKPAAAKKASTAKKPSTAKKAAKKPAAKKSAKKAAKSPAAKKAAKKGPKADKGKPKPRLDYDVGMREVLAAIRAAGKPVGRGDIEQATGYTGVQVRTFAKALNKAGKISILGQGGRSTQYALPS